MKFGKTYHEFMQGQEELPRVGIKQLKKMLKRCRAEVQAKNDSFRRPQPLTCSDETEEGELERNHSVCPQHCAVCDGSFFPALLREMEAVTGCFNERARRLLELHLASGLRKYFNLLKRRMHLSHHENLMQEGKDLVTYAIINSIAMRKILKKYDKIHYSRQGQEFKTRAQVMHIEILQSPWLCELMAFYINERECKAKKKAAPSPAAELFKDCYMGVDDDGKPFLFCGLFVSLKVEIDLTCSICLDPVFDPVSLSCGHIFCFVCGCSAASVSIVDGMKAADSSARCPLCRQERVYRGAVHLDELNILLKRSCPEYWAKRARSERAERLRLAKEHWDSLSRAFTGI